MKHHTTNPEVFVYFVSHKPINLLWPIGNILKWFQHTNVWILIFSKFLSDFRHKCSCQTTLVRMIEKWKVALDNCKNGKHSCCRLQEAFNSLPYVLLIATLTAYGMDIKSSKLISTWWRHQMETFSALLVICAGNSPVLGEFPTQRPVMWSFDVFFDLRLNKRLSKQSWGWWFETLSRPLWCHRNAYLFNHCHSQDWLQQ